MGFLPKKKPNFVLDCAMSKFPIIKAELKSKLLAGGFREGEALPSEVTLAKHYGVSRMTARRAVDELEREGYIFRIQGAGSYPTGKRFRQGVFRVRSLEEMAFEKHAAPFTRVLKAQISTASIEVASALGLAGGAAVLEVQRLRGIEDTPLLLEERHFKIENTERLLKMPLHQESIHALLVGLGITVARVEQTLEAVALDAGRAKLLGVATGAAAFLMTRHSFTPEAVLGFSRYWVRGDGGAFASVFEP
jgi:DNA-binding GntR family transcriptional regulator